MRSTDGPCVRVYDVPASWNGYPAVEASLDPPPAGLVLHLAGPTDEGFRIVEVWAAEADAATFDASLEAALRAVDPVIQPRSVIRALRAAHVVVGGARASPSAPATQLARAQQPNDIGG